jgi:hypothetical protein
MEGKEEVEMGLSGGEGRALERGDDGVLNCSCECCSMVTLIGGA